MSSLINSTFTIDKEKNCLIFQGKPFFYLADTWWFALTGRTSFSDFKKLVANRKKKGFTVVQIVVGIPPETKAFSKDASNLGGLPFEKDWSLNKKYFDEAGKKISHLIKNNIAPCIVGGWGHHIDWMGKENTKKLWKEIISRWASYPVIFCLCGEVDGFLQTGQPDIKSKFGKNLKRHLPVFFLEKLRAVKYFVNGKKLLERRLRGWDEIARYIKRIDKYNNVLTVHTSALRASSLFKNPKWLDVDSIQSGHSKERSRFMVEAILKNPGKPIVNLEPWYEGILGNFKGKDQRFAFWACILSGAKGHSYGAHGLWQMSKKGENFMGHWGKSDWQTAINFEGSRQLGLAKKFLENYPWWKLKPNFTKVVPHFSNKFTNLPICAEIGDRYTYVYFPSVTKNKNYIIGSFNPEKSYEKLWINPKTMRVFKSEVFKGKMLKVNLKNPQGLKDMLLVIQEVK